MKYRRDTQEDIDPRFERARKIWAELEPFEEFLTKREREDWFSFLDSFNRFLADIKNKERSPRRNEQDATVVSGRVSETLKSLSDRTEAIIRSGASPTLKKSDLERLQKLAGLVDVRVKRVQQDYKRYFVNADKALRVLLETINKKIESEDKNIQDEAEKKRKAEEESCRMREEKAREDRERFKSVIERWDALFSVSKEMLDGGACMIKIARGPFHFTEYLELREGQYRKGRIPFFKETKDPAILGLYFFSRGGFKELAWSQFRKVFEQVKLLFPKWLPPNMKVLIRGDRDFTNDDWWGKLCSTIGTPGNSFFVSPHGFRRFLVSRDKDARHHIMLIDLCENGLDLTFFTDALGMTEIEGYVNGFLAFFAGKNTPKRNFGVGFATSNFPLSA